MAINKVDYPSTLSEQADFSAHGELIETRFLDQSYDPLQVVSGNIPQGVVFQVGGVVYRADSDTAVSGTTSDYVKIVPDGATATAEYVTDLTGVSWSKQWNGYYDGSGNLYIFDEGKALAAGDITSVFGRYLAQQANGDVQVGNDLTVSNDLAVDGRVKVEGPSSTTVPMINIDATSNAGANATLIKGSIESNTTNRYFLDFEGKGGAKNLQVTTNGDITSAGTLSASTVNARGMDTFGGFYQGSTTDATSLPVGSVVLVDSPGPIAPNTLTTIYVVSGGYSLSGTTTLSGSWRCRGVSNGAGLFQRVS